MILDIRNCLIDDHNCSQICIELEGSFNCSCYSGYKLLEDGANCEGTYLIKDPHTYYFNNFILLSDIDECTLGLAGCSYNCTNTLGSFYCTCMDGFELLSDNRSCTGN